ELHADMSRTRPLLGWVVMQDQRGYPGKFIARLVTDYDPDRFIARLATDREPSHVLVANTLDEIRAMLPPRLVRIERLPGDPADVVEAWIMTQGPNPSSTGSPSTGPFEHAMSLLTAMSTATQLFVGLTGAVWVVLVPNTMALPASVVTLALLLHGLLGTV